MPRTPDRDDWLAMDDAGLQACCDVHVYRSSGPGGQHRNKVSSAVRLRHRPTGISATGDESRSQHDNRRQALRRMRMNLACQCRRIVPAGPEGARWPQVVEDCLFVPRGRAGDGTVRRLQIGPRDARFWQVAAVLLDLLDSAEGRLAEAAAMLGISTTNLANVLASERHLLGEAQKIRKRYGHGPLN